MAIQTLKKPWSTNQSFMALNEGINKIDTINELLLLNLNDVNNMGVTTFNNIISSTGGSVSYVRLPLIPDNLAEKYTPTIVKQQPFGTIHPLNFYVAGGEKTISFNIEVHEDVKGVGDLYAFVAKLKSMNHPVVRNGVVEGPSVYIQLGRQFAGKGHITTSITYKKPFSRGRYKAASIGITFVFHKLLDNNSTLVLQKLETTEYSDDYGSEFTLTEEDFGAGTGLLPISDFYQKYIIDDYFVGQHDFVKQKLSLLWSVSVDHSNMMEFDYRYSEGTSPVTTADGTKVDPDDELFFDRLAEWYLTPPLNEDEFVDYEDFLFQVGYMYNTEHGHQATNFSYNSAVHPYIIDLMIILRNYYNVLRLLGSMSYSDAVTNLSLLLDSLNDLIERFKTPPALYASAFNDYYDRDPVDYELQGIYQITGYGASTENDVNYNYIVMTSLERNTFKRIVGGFIPENEHASIAACIAYDNGLRKMLESYIDTYEILSGAGG